MIRLFFTGNPGFVADVAFWKSWSLAAADHGIVWTAHNTNINYPPGFIYVLWLMGKAYALFTDPHNFNAYWQTNNFLFLLISKLPAIIADLIIGYLIYWFSKLIIKGKNLPLLLSALFLLNPVVILDSAVWGQVESFGMLFTILAVILFYKQKPALAAAIFTIGVFMKLQNIIYIPLIYLFIWRYFDFKTLIKSLASSLLVFIIIVFPFLLAKDFDRVLYLMVLNNDYFPWLSLHAHNPWWIVAGGNMLAPDKILTIGIIQAKKLGLIFFSSIYLFLTLLILKRPSIRNLISALAIIIFAFFLFTTQSHDRYNYPVIVWILFLFPFLETKFLHKYTLIIFLLLTFAIFFNMHEGLFTNYPENGIALLGKITNSLTNNLNSIFLTLLFFALIPIIFRQLSQIYLLIPPLFIISAIIILNLPFYIKGKIYLSSLKPIYARQGFGTLQYDKAVNSYSGPKNWNILSSNYFFYTKGLGTHAHSEVSYDLGKKFSRFSTDYGVDSEAGTSASVTFEIKGDGKVLFTSSKMGRFDFPKHTEIDVKKMQTLTLIVYDAGDGNDSDHADWLNAILYK